MPKPRRTAAPGDAEPQRRKPASRAELKRRSTLGVEFLVDELEVLLTEQRLLPVTVGVAGDWGSGKTSLMQMTQDRLQSGENAGRFICVRFTPWRFEDFNYGKVALMAAVVDAIADHADQHKSRLGAAAEKANHLRHLLHRWGLFKQAATVGTIVAGGSPVEAQAAAAGAEILGELGPPDDNGPQRSFETVSHFHEYFNELIDSLGDGVQAVVVFVDDIDRARPRRSSKPLRRCGCSSTHRKPPTSSERIIKYQLHGNPDSDLAARRRSAPWYRQKSAISYADMRASLRRELIRHEYWAQPPAMPTTPQITPAQSPSAQAAA